jgi:hypothetical protein
MQGDNAEKPASDSIPKFFRRLWPQFSVVIVNAGF